MTIHNSLLKAGSKQSDLQCFGHHSGGLLQVRHKTCTKAFLLPTNRMHNSSTTWSAYYKRVPTQRITDVYQLALRLLPESFIVLGAFCTMCKASLTFRVRVLVAVSIPLAVVQSISWLPTTACSATAERSVLPFRVWRVCSCVLTAIV